MLGAQRALIAACFCLMAFGCASAPDQDDEFLGSDARPADRIYNSGLDYLFDREYIYALEEFNRVEELYPYSAWVRHGLLMAGFTHYLINQYQEAAAQFDRFIALYPGNKNVAYAYYLRAMCFYEQIGESNRDQSTSLQAQRAFRQVIGLFPDTAYARDAAFKISLVEASLAAKEMYLARWAMEHNEFSGAINRFRSVVLNYGRTAYVPEALHRMVEVYLTLGLDNEARQTATLLSHNFSDSKWYKYSHEMLSEAGLTKNKRVQ